jgi:hypothetical protein
MFGVLGCIALALQSCGQGTFENSIFPLTIETLSVAGIGTRFEPVRLTAEGGAPAKSYTWSITGGSKLPFGMSLDHHTGTLTGVLSDATGGVPFDCAGSSTPCGKAYKVSMTVTDGTDTASSDVTIYDFDPGSQACVSCDTPTTIVLGAPDALAVDGKLQTLGSVTDYDVNESNFGAKHDFGFYPMGAPSSAPHLASIPAGFSFGLALPVYGGTPPYTGWQIISGSLPPGLLLDPTHGVIYGVPLAGDTGETYLFSIGVSDSTGAFAPDPALGQVMVTYSITIIGGSYL